MTTSFQSVTSFIERNKNLMADYRIYGLEEGGGSVLCEFDNRGWDFSVEFHEDGSVEMYGIEIDGKGEMQPQVFSSVDDEFLKFFNEHVK